MIHELASRRLLGEAIRTRRRSECCSGNAPSSFKRGLSPVARTNGSSNIKHHHRYLMRTSVILPTNAISVKHIYLLKNATSVGLLPQRSARRGAPRSSKPPALQPRHHMTSLRVILGLLFSLCIEGLSQSTNATCQSGFEWVSTQGSFIRTPP